MTVSTRLAVMREGQIAQLGEPREVYETPNSRYVAEFIGDVNILEGTGASGMMRLAGGQVVDLGEGRQLADGAGAAVALRPEKLVIERAGEAADGVGANRLPGTVEDIAYLGDMSIYHVRLPSGELLRAARTNRMRALEGTISWNDPVVLGWEPGAAVLLA